MKQEAQFAVGEGVSFEQRPGSGTWQTGIITSCYKSRGRWRYWVEASWDSRLEYLRAEDQLRKAEAKA